MGGLRRRQQVLLTSATLCLVLLLAHPIWFTWLGELLVHSDQPAPAQAAIVLAGGLDGSRILWAAELARANYCPTVLVSGATEIYGVNEATLAIDHAVRHGFHPDLFQPVEFKASSTTEEALRFRERLQSGQLRRILVVTTNFHTARARRMFRRALGDDYEIRMIAAPDRYFEPSAWWKHREARKTFLMEWLKTFASWVE